MFRHSLASIYLYRTQFYSKFNMEQLTANNLVVGEGTHPENTHPSIYVVDLHGEVYIQLEGSHTTSSVTDNDSSKPYVKFEEGLNAFQNDPKSEVAKISCVPKEEEDCETQKGTNPQGAEWEKTDEFQRKHQMLTERFAQLTETFDAITKNLEALAGISEASKSFRDMDRRISEPEGDSLDAQCSVSATLSSLEVNASLGLQENLSIGPTSLIALSEPSSKSLMLNSLANYASAENALQCHTSPEGHPLNELSSNSKTPRITTEEPQRQEFHTIHIDTSYSPSLSMVQRPPLCQRLWDGITYFCGALCLCLQVNRNCIFCLAFFAAFVVSASFLTAFFYHALSISPLLMQPPPPMRLSEDKGYLWKSLE
uniref:Uncharacterized protein n=1 Tax=Stomoxys calcitrans TaxID=35570 RepID=A0A1I8NQE6_STOCA